MLLVSTIDSTMTTGDYDIIIIDSDATSYVDKKNQRKC